MNFPQTLAQLLTVNLFTITIAEIYGKVNSLQNLKLC